MLSVCELLRSADVHCLALDNVDNVGVSAASAAVDHLPICPTSVLLRETESLDRVTAALLSPADIEISG